MKRPISHSEQVPVSSAFAFQRMSLAACIILAPLSIGLHPEERFMRTFDDGQGPVAEAKRSRRGHTCFA
jgi:hypothetical protein